MLHSGINAFQFAYGPLTRYVKLPVAHAPGMPGTFSPPPWVSDPSMHHDTCVTHVPWCMPGSLTGGFLWSRWRGKRSRHSRRMRNPRFHVSGKRPIVGAVQRTVSGLRNVGLPKSHKSLQHISSNPYSNAIQLSLNLLSFRPANHTRGTRCHIS